MLMVQQDVSDILTISPRGQNRKSGTTSKIVRYVTQGGHPLRWRSRPEITLSKHRGGREKSAVSANNMYRSPLRYGPFRRQGDPASSVPDCRCGIGCLLAHRLGPVGIEIGQSLRRPRCRLPIGAPRETAGTRQGPRNAGEIRARGSRLPARHAP